MPRIDDGGPAYPRPGFHPGDCSGMDIEDVREAIEAKTEAQRGMSLRDHFAGICLTNSFHDYGRFSETTPDGRAANRAYLAQECYEMADAMLAARSQQPQAT